LVTDYKKLGLFYLLLFIDIIIPATRLGRSYPVNIG